MEFFSNTQYWIRHLAQRHRSSVTEHRTSSYLQPKIYLWSNDLKGPYSWRQSVLPFRWNMNVIWMSYSFDWPDNRQQTHVTNCINPSPSSYDMTKILRSLIEAKTTFIGRIYYVVVVFKRDMWTLDQWLLNICWLCVRVYHDKIEPIHHS